MSTQEDPEQIAVRLMAFRHTDEDPPKDVVINDVPITVTEDSTMSGLAEAIRRAQEGGN